MLDVVRQYALERLEARDEADEARSRHAHYFMTLAAPAERARRGPEESIGRAGGRTNSAISAPRSSGTPIR